MEKSSKDSRINIRCDYKDIEKLTQIQEIFARSGEKKTTTEVLLLALDQMYMRMKDQESGNIYSDYLKSVVDESNRLAAQNIARLEDKNMTAIAKILYQVYLSNIFIACCFKLPEDLNRVFDHNQIESLIKERSIQTFDQFISEFTNNGEEKSK